MSQSTLSAPPAELAQPQTRETALKVTQWRVIVSEWIKIRSLRSTVYTLLATVVVVVGFGVIAALTSTGAITSGDDGPDGADFGTDPVAISLTGVMLAQLLIGVLGVLVITAEYSTGVIRSTFAAVPKRLPVLWAKAGVLAVVTGVPMLVAVFTAFFTGQAILSGDGTGAALTDPGVLRAVLGSVGFLAGVALLGLAIGAIVRNTAGAIAALVAILLLLPGLLGLVLPSGWGDTVVSYLPSNAAAAFTTVNPGADLPSSGAGLAVFAGYLVVLFGVAAVLLVRRDA